MAVSSEKKVGDAPEKPTFLEAFRVWAKIGFLSFGGPAGQIALMHKELVETRRWVSEARFLHALNYCMLLPGPEAQQLATYIGWLLHGTRGGIVAGTFFILPGFVVILTLSALYAQFHETDWLNHLFFGLKAAVLAIVFEAVLKVARRALKSPAHWVMAGASFLVLYVGHVPFPLIILAAGLIGYFGSRFDLAAFRAKPSTEAPALEATHDSRPPATLRTIRTALLWIFIWFAPVALLAAFWGPDSSLVTLGTFFAKLAVVTFGGAYAVLSYVADVAVTGFHWLKPGEMLDGLALAETTPGPLLLVLPFVGFQAAFRASDAYGGLLSGVLGAGIVAWVTFAPSFLWIFVGAPYIERLRGMTALSSALTGITAAVVGVILNLAIWFALHTLFYDLTVLTFGPISVTVPILSTIDLRAAALGTIAVALLFRLRFGILPTLAVTGGLGWVLKLLG